jgi:hypothetical protein
MSEWIDFSVFVLFNVVMLFMMPRLGMQLTKLTIAERNPEWAAEHTTVLPQIAGSLLLRAACYFCGALGIAASLAFMLYGDQVTWLSTKPWQTLSAINAIPALAGGVFLVMQSIVATRRIERHVPLAERRQATLQRRSMENFVPAWIRMAIPALQIAIFGGVAVAGLLADAPASHWTGLGVGVFASVMVGIVTVSTVEQRANSLDRLYGAAFRRFSVHTLVGFQFLILFWAAMGLYQYVTGSTAIDAKRIGFLSIILFPLLATLASLARFRKPPSDDGSGEAQPERERLPGSTSLSTDASSRPPMAW